MRVFLLIIAVLFSANASADVVRQTKGTFEDKFRQLEEHLPTPNVYRTGSGAPGHAYWQQKVDYKIAVTLNEKDRTITGSQTVKYKNNSPDTLTYLWLQLDQNRFSKHSDAVAAMDQADATKKKMTYSALEYIARTHEKDWGYTLTRIEENGRAANYTINDTMMRIDLAKPLAPGDAVTLEMDWWFNIVEGQIFGARGGYEPYERHGNDVFFISQWFPRLAAYTDMKGWEHKQFLGTGEFTLEFGDYNVEITVPSDHIVGSTGELQNPRDVLTSAQRDRLQQARTAKSPVFIVTREEALENEKEKTADTKTWKFSAENVRDFAFGSSRKFVWDAVGVKMPQSGRTVMAMSLYPDESMPLWDKYSTHSVAHTLETYSRYSLEYPYPVAWSVNGPIGGGMEYPMITSNGPRPVIEEIDGKEVRTYTKTAKYSLISIVIHEIGHIYFPMVINSDERNWAWMDEGLNSFLQSQAEREWEPDYPGPLGFTHPSSAIPYMLSPNQSPIMTQADSIVGYFPNAYTKTAIALNILRETVMGRELFDFAFKEYARRWAFKRPYPADFFRTMEDASSKDLDWFFRGWFYTTDHVDIGISSVTHARINTGDPAIENPINREEAAKKNAYVAEMRNNAAKMDRRVDRFPELLDFYNENDDFIVTETQRKAYDRKLADLKGWEKELLKFGHELYFIDFNNIGGLVMPLVLKVDYEDGSTEDIRVAAEIWRRDAKSATKLLVRNKKIKSITLDPYNELADADHSNNIWPAKPMMSRVELFKTQGPRNLMKEVLSKKEKTDSSENN